MTSNREAFSQAGRMMAVTTSLGEDVLLLTDHQRPYDRDLYRERNLIERFFAKLKQFRRVATRYDKLLANFMGFVKLAAIAIWLK